MHALQRPSLKCTRAKVRVYALDQPKQDARAAALLPQVHAGQSTRVCAGPAKQGDALLQRSILESTLVKVCSCVLALSRPRQGNACALAPPSSPCWPRYACARSTGLSRISHMLQRSFLDFMLPKAAEMQHAQPVHSNAAACVHALPEAGVPHAGCSSHPRRCRGSACSSQHASCSGPAPMCTAQAQQEARPGCSAACSSLVLTEMPCLGVPSLLGLQATTAQQGRGGEGSVTEVLEQTLWNRSLGVMSEEIVAALVCQIFEGGPRAAGACHTWLVRVAGRAEASASGVRGLLEHVPDGAACWRACGWPRPQAGGLREPVPLLPCRLTRGSVRAQASGTRSCRQWSSSSTASC